jgi:hypothetical protein
MVSRGLLLQHLCIKIISLAVCMAVLLIFNKELLKDLHLVLIYFLYVRIADSTLPSCVVFYINTLSHVSSHPSGMNVRICRRRLFRFLTGGAQTSIASALYASRLVRRTFLRYCRYDSQLTVFFALDDKAAPMGISSRQGFLSFQGIFHLI